MTPEGKKDGLESIWLLKDSKAQTRWMRKDRLKEIDQELNVNAGIV